MSKKPPFWYHATWFLLGWFIGSYLVGDFNLHSVVLGAGVSILYAAIVRYIFGK